MLGKADPRPAASSRGLQRLVAVGLAVVALLAGVACQDLLRNQGPRSATNGGAHQQQQHHRHAGGRNREADFNQQLANIQLPPQLASLTPAQLHQLARIRELQLQQEAEQGARRQQSAAPGSMAAASSEYDGAGQAAPAPLGLENSQPLPRPTAQPAAPASPNQIPQPSTAAAAAAAAAAGAPEENDRHDDGAYTEAGTEMEGVSASQEAAAGAGDTSRNSASPAASSSNAASGATSASANAAAPASPTFEVNWNKCPQLEPSESEKNKKTQVITKCLQAAPIPANLTHENVEAHREQIATCALKVEGWFDEQGDYRFDKAESEIRAKRLDAPIELQVLKFHVACREEASKKFPRQQNKLIDQVQFYQACMDYYISIVCEIEVSVDQ